MSRGGPFRRRREKRQLEQLAEASQSEGTPRTISVHVRVIEDQAGGRDQDLEQQDPDSPIPDSPIPDSPIPDSPIPDSPIEDAPQRRTGGFHVRAVPIDQPIGE